jgi:ArsR family transcriptional regulator
MPKTLNVTGLDLTTPTCCPPLTAVAGLDATSALEIAVRLKALADPVRLQLVSQLLSAPDNELRTRDLAPILAITEATVSHHLKQLLETGLVTKRRERTSVYYRLDLEAVGALARVITVPSR